MQLDWNRREYSCGVAVNVLRNNIQDHEKNIKPIYVLNKCPWHTAHNSLYYFKEQKKFSTYSFPASAKSINNNINQ